jgi:hypothetical protein
MRCGVSASPGAETTTVIVSFLGWVGRGDGVGLLR